jgi:MYXO-CTERM domain-containing protein
VALVVAGILLLSGLQVYGLLRWPFARMLLEHLTRGAVLISGLIVGVFWTLDEGQQVLQQWLAVFTAGGLGLLGLAILRYLDDQRREAQLQVALASSNNGAHAPREHSHGPQAARPGWLLLGLLLGAWLGRRQRP